MRLELFSEEDKVLLLGEGNFSFSVCLLKHNLPIEIVATCFEKEISYKLQAENVEYLRSKKVPIFLNVDATKLHENVEIVQQKFTKVVFNFPHVGGKMKIHLNRQLLKNIFESCHHILPKGGQVILSLCKGQGGTPADETQRKWADSWQVTEMAAHGDFILTGVENFVQKNFPEYTCIGYRSQDVKFNLDGALVHVFSKSSSPYDIIDDKTPDIRLKKHPLNTNSNIYADVVYTELFCKNLILNEDSPITFFKNHLTSFLKHPVKTLDDDSVPLYFADGKGPPCEVKGSKNSYFLRSCPIDSLNYILESINFNSVTLFHSGKYFSSNLSEDFLNYPPVYYKFIVIGSDISEMVLKFLKSTSCIFKENNLTFSKTESTVLSDQLNSCITQASKLTFSDSNISFTGAEIYLLKVQKKVLEAGIIHIDLICKHFFKMRNWRELWSDKSKVVWNGSEIPVLKQNMLYPSSYEFDLTLRHSSEDNFCEKHFLKVLWLASSLLIEKVKLISVYDSDKGWSSKCYRITYKSLDKPLYREKVIEIHSNIIAKMMEKALNVSIG